MIQNRTSWLRKWHGRIYWLKALWIRRLTNRGCTQKKTRNIQAKELHKKTFGHTYQRLLLPGIDVLSLGFRKMIPNLLVTGRIEHFFNLIDWIGVKWKIITVIIMIEHFPGFAVMCVFSWRRLNEGEEIGWFRYMVSPIWNTITGCSMYKLTLSFERWSSYTWFHCWVY